MIVSTPVEDQALAAQMASWFGQVVGWRREAKSWIVIRKCMNMNFEQKFRFWYGGLTFKKNIMLLERCDSDLAKP